MATAKTTGRDAGRPGRGGQPRRGRAGAAAPHAAGPGTPKAAGKRVPLTLRLSEAEFARLEALAAADNRSLANFAETALLRSMAAQEEAARVITMTVPEEARGLTPGPLLRSEDESDERHARRRALMDRLFALDDNAG